MAAVISAHFLHIYRGHIRSSTDGCVRNGGIHSPSPGVSPVALGRPLFYNLRGEGVVENVMGVLRLAEVRRKVCGRSAEGRKLSRAPRRKVAEAWRKFPRKRRSQLAAELACRFRVALPRIADLCSRLVRRCSLLYAVLVWCSLISYRLVDWLRQR